MKIYEIATCMELIVKILRELPDGELPKTLEHLLNMVQKSKDKRSDQSRVLTKLIPISQKTVDRLATMSPSEIEQFLSTSEEFTNVGRLRELAEYIGITASRRQNHAALVNMIARHFEARQMDFIIRGSRTRDESLRESASD